MSLRSSRLWCICFKCYLYREFRGYIYYTKHKLPQMFKGNSDGNSIHYNVFEVPIIAQWVRINPTRWHDRISMRVELYGCDYGESD